MSTIGQSFTTELKQYLTHFLADRHNTVAETSRYGYLQALLNAAGATLDSPKAYAIIHPVNTGAGIPDLGILSEKQPIDARPQYGVVEVKPTTVDVLSLAQTEQVSKYLLHYGLVLVTNYYQFLLVTLDEHGGVRAEEQYRLAEDEAAIWRAVEQPHRLAQAHGVALLE